MSVAGTDDITSLLLAHQHGDSAALDRVWPLVYDHLRAIAGRQLQRGAPATLNATALVHEAYLRLADDTRLHWQNRAHFLAIAARCMRQVIVDAARARRAIKRGGGRSPESLNPELIAIDTQAELIVAIDAALESVASFNERMGRIAECRLFAGLTEEETAHALGMSLRTVQRDWQRARAWLQRELSEEGSV
jgi:RNA polymerase sigma-70 factor, ECF subfamily